MIEKLKQKIQGSYEQGVTVLEAEKLASEFLHAQLQLSEKMRTADLDVRMRKSGLKAIRAAVYIEMATKTDKKPSDAMIDAYVNRNALVQLEQQAYDELEVELNYLRNSYDIFNNAHIFFRGVAKGKFE